MCSSESLAACPASRPLPLTLPASAHFVFVVDEAAPFVDEQAMRSTAHGPISQESILQRLRHALRVLGRHENVFGLFLDADTQICRLPPTTDNHRYLTPTMREEDLLMVQPERVLPPFGPLPMCHPGPTTRHLRHHALLYHPLLPLYHPLGGDGGGGGGGVQVSYCPATLALSFRPLFAMHIHRQLQPQPSQLSPPSEISFGRQAQVLDKARHTAQSKLLAATPTTRLPRDVPPHDGEGGPPTRFLSTSRVPPPLVRGQQQRRRWWCVPLRRITP